MHLDHQPAPRAQHPRLPPTQIGGLAPDITSLTDVLDQLYADFTQIPRRRWLLGAVGERTTYMPTWLS